MFAFFDDHGLTPELLREVSQHQVRLLAELFDDLDAEPTLITRDRVVPLEATGGFLGLRSPHAAALGRLLREREVFTDHRGDVLRLGPAPYLTDDQLRTAIDVLGSLLSSLRDRPVPRQPLDLS